MLERKNPKSDVRRYSALFFNVGLVAALGLVLMAFEWKSITPITDITPDDLDSDWTELLDIPPTAHIPPPPPPVVNPVINEVPDTEQIEEKIETIIDLDPVDIDYQLVFVEEPTKEKAEDVFDIVEEFPKFNNAGQEEFLRYVSSKLNYPSQARRMGIEGKVFVRFIVDRTGKMTDIEVVRGIGAGCDEEVLRVLNAAPAWQPGKQRGVPVNVRMMIPVTFRLN